MTRFFSPVSFAGGIVLGVVLAGIWVATSPSAPHAAPSTDGPTATLTGTPSGVVSVSDQAAGTSVAVESVTVPPPGVWVAVREVNDGALGNVLGAARVGGPRTAIDVPLLRATAPGQTYAIELYRDSGDDAFDLTTDSVYVDFDTGSRVVAYFTTTN